MGTTIAQNRKARFNYFILETIEAGICLVGSEVKALRIHKANIAECYVTYKEGEMWAFNLHIPQYTLANRLNHDPIRLKKLLMKKKEINKIIGKLKADGVTIVVTSMYFNNRGLAKLQLAVAKGKKLYDKRHAIKEREWNRSKKVDI